ncbi:MULTISPECIES: RES family NAD+ phosphorylase [Cupriavidus]|uniref:RES domain-containing protein n=1 Tax=Cupriavidus pinatubonensis (strain JMP 134 / LMG 1197) TaxID=264198 RepID=Q472J2_CUPPJ|nr:MULTISPECIES: RES family NAD+ phosphorylase [Cupriavidus]QYY32895.1 RES family NAD+ phosphorylase [Cupriavidus pinatubonensis]
MSFTTWTPPAVASERQPFALTLWRAVEAQHVVSTMPLVDSLDEQAVLEAVLDAGKPAVPAEARHLHYLLFTPFRYPPSPWGSRFRAGQDPGVFYGAEEIRTACAELGYWRWRFLNDSPALPRIDARAQTLFQVSVRTEGVALDTPPFDRDSAQWTDPDSHEACQAFGRIAREAGIGLIRYTSVRDPGHGPCGAVMTPRAFDHPLPLATTTWMLTVRRDRVIWQRDDLQQRDSFEFAASLWQRTSERSPEG